MSDERTSTSELTPAEIAVAQSLGKLTVEASGLGFVPTQWLADFRARIAKREPREGTG